MSFHNAKVHPGSVNPKVYHDVPIPRGHRDYPVSPSVLKVIDDSPETWLISGPDKPTKAKDFGDLLDCLVLTPDLFSERYVVRPDTYAKAGMECPTCKSVTDSKSCRACKCERVPVNTEVDWSDESNTCKAWLAEHAKGRNVISTDEQSAAQFAADRMLKDEFLGQFIESSDKQVLVTGEWHDADTGLVIPVRCLIDLVPRLDTEFCKAIGDVKSTRDAARKSFRRDIFTFGHHIQAAFDLDLYTAATGEDRVTWCFLVEESKPPFRLGRRGLTDRFMQLGRTQYTLALKAYCLCLSSGKWSGYDDHAGTSQGWTMEEPEPWMEREVMEKLPPLVIPPEPEREQYEGEVVP